MALHDEFLALARRLVPALVQTTSPRPTEADLRRGVSTAYYALFHLLIHKATTRVVTDPQLQSKFGRVFDHGPMKQVCTEYSSVQLVGGVPTRKNGNTFAIELRKVAIAFTTLQDARHEADYNTGFQLSHQEANKSVTDVEAAFEDWQAIESLPEAEEFLVELFLRSAKKR